MTREEMREIAEQASDDAIKKMLLALGINAYDPESIKAFQKDAAFTRTLRESSEAVKRKAILTAISVFVTGMIAYVWTSFRPHP